MTIQIEICACTNWRGWENDILMWTLVWGLQCVCFRCEWPVWVPERRRTRKQFVVSVHMSTSHVFTRSFHQLSGEGVNAEPRIENTTCLADETGSATGFTYTGCMFHLPHSRFQTRYMVQNVTVKTTYSFRASRHKRHRPAWLFCSPSFQHFQVNETLRPVCRYELQAELPEV